MKIDKEKTSVMFAMMGLSAVLQCPIPECDARCGKCSIGRQTTFCGVVIKELEKEEA